MLPVVVAAIENAIFDAAGVRMRQFPMTSRWVLAAFKVSIGQFGGDKLYTFFPHKGIRARGRGTNTVERSLFGKVGER